MLRLPGSTATVHSISTFPISREIPILLMYLPEDALRARQYRKFPIHDYFSLKYFFVLMDLLQTDSTVRAFLFHSRVCGPHVNFRGVDRKALTNTAASPYIEASGWLFSLSWSSWSWSSVVGRRWSVG